MPRVHYSQPGECLVRVAWRYLLQYKTVSDSAGNKDLVAKRQDPHMLFPGEKVVIPDQKPMSWVLETGKHHRIVVPVPKKELRLVIKDESDEPMASESYDLHLEGVRPEKQDRSGSTDGQGMLRERIPLACQSGVLKIAGWQIRLRLGYLHPLPADEKDPVSGVESRLRSLGYSAGQSARPSAKSGRVVAPDTKVALAIFQTDAELDVSGEPDDATLDKIKDSYGC